MVSGRFVTSAMPRAHAIPHTDMRRHELSEAVFPKNVFASDGEMYGLGKWIQETGRQPQNFWETIGWCKDVSKHWPKGMDDTDLEADISEHQPIRFDPDSDMFSVLARVPDSSYRRQELKWERGQITVDGHVPPPPITPLFIREYTWFYEIYGIEGRVPMSDHENSLWVTLAREAFQRFGGRKLHKKGPTQPPGPHPSPSDDL